MLTKIILKTVSESCFINKPNKLLNLITVNTIKTIIGLEHILQYSMFVE